MSVTGPRPRIGRDHLHKVAAVFAEVLNDPHSGADVRDAVRYIARALGDIYAAAIGSRFDAGKWYAATNQRERGEAKR